jgi:hypothetical protein
MVKAAAPIDLLRQHRALFATMAEEAKEEKAAARNVVLRELADHREKIALKWVSEIDATLRDWA